MIADGSGCFDEVALFVEVFDALDDGGVVAGVHVGTERVEDVDLALEEHYGVEVAEDVGGDDDGLRLVRLPEHLLEVLLEVVAVGIEAAEEEAMALEGLLLPNPLLLLQLHVLHQLGVVERRLPEEVDLPVAELVRPGLEVVGDLVVGHPILEVLFAVVVVHEFVELFEFQPPPGEHCLHDPIDWLLHRLGVEALEGLRGELRLGCEVFHDCAGHEAADAVGRAIPVGQVLHFLRVLVEHQQLADLHFDYRQQVTYLFIACSISF